MPFSLIVLKKKVFISRVYFSSPVNLLHFRIFSRKIKKKSQDNFCVLKYKENGGMKTEIHVNFVFDL